MLVTDDIQALSSAVSGPVALPDSPEFAAETFAFNAGTVHRPDVVLGAENAQDVAAGVKWAAERRLPVAVQSTGHGANFAIDGGLLITTRRLQDLQIDPDKRTARVGAGVKWRSVLEASVPQGLIPLHGSSTDVGVVGYTLGGGLPVLGRAHGFAAEQVRSMELVTADGVPRRIDAETEAELFALMCGGKGNFGIVTALEFNLFPLGDFYGGAIFYPGVDAGRILAAFREWLPTLPDEASPSISLLRLPDMEFVPPPLRNQFVVHLRFAFPGNREDGDALLAPMRAVSAPLMDTVGPMDYLDVDQIHMDPVDPLPYTEGGVLLKDFGEETVADSARAGGRGLGLSADHDRSPPARRGAGQGPGPGGRRVRAGCRVPSVPCRDQRTARGRGVPRIHARDPGRDGAPLNRIYASQFPWRAGRRGRPGPGMVARRVRTNAGRKATYDPGNLLRFGHAITGVPSAT